MQKCRRFIFRMSDIAVSAAAVVLLVMFVINCIDIVGTRFFNCPFPGTIELTGYMMSLAIPAAAAHLFLYRQHIRIEIITGNMPKFIRYYLDRAIALMVFVLFSFIVWRMFSYGMERHGYREYSDELHFPFYYVIYAVSLAFVPLCLAALYDFLTVFKKRDSSDDIF